MKTYFSILVPSSKPIKVALYHFLCVPLIQILLALMITILSVVIVYCR